MWVNSKAREEAWVFCMFGWLIRFSQAQLPQFVLRSVSSSWSKGKWIHSNLQSSSTRRRLQTKDTERYREFSVKFVQFSSLLKFFPVCVLLVKLAKSRRCLEDHLHRRHQYTILLLENSLPRRWPQRSQQINDLTWQISYYWQSLLLFFFCFSLKV